MKLQTLTLSTGENLKRNNYLIRKAEELEIEDHDDVEGILDFIEEGKEPEEKWTEEALYRFQEVKKDFDRSNTDKPYELSLVQYGSELSFEENLRVGYQSFDFGPHQTRFKPLPNVVITPQHYIAALKLGLRMENAGQWIVGNAAACLEAIGKKDVVNQICSDFNKAYTTVSAWIRTARRIREEDRIPSIPFTVYAEIATSNYSEDPKENDQKMHELVQRANEEKWSSVEAREEVRQAKGSEKTMKPLKPKYILILPDQPPLLCKEEPVYSEGAIIIDTDKRQYLGLVENKVEWLTMLREP